MESDWRLLYYKNNSPEWKEVFGVEIPADTDLKKIIFTLSESSDDIKCFKIMHCGAALASYIVAIENPDFKYLELNDKQIILTISKQELSLLNNCRRPRNS